MPSSADPFLISDAITLAVREYPPSVARLYVALSVSLARVSGVVVTAGSHGFIGHELRGYRGSDWCFSLVLNKQWIRLYVRSPELSRGLIITDQFQSDFPLSEITAKGEIALNVSSKEMAKSVCDWMERHPQKM